MLIEHWFDTPERRRQRAMAEQQEPEPQGCALWDHLAAIHESAHCVYAYFTGAPVHDVAINGQGLGGGEFRHTDLPPIELVTDDDDPKARARQDIQIVTAINRDTEEVWVRGLIGLKTGKVAQHAFGAKGEFYGRACEHDDEIISRVLGLMSKSPEHRRRLYCRIEVEAELFVKKYWSAILRLADELLRKKHLDKNEIEAVLAPKPTLRTYSDNDAPFFRRTDGYLIPPRREV